MEKEHYLVATYDAEHDEIGIYGNSVGLKYLANLLLDAANFDREEHWHVSWTNNVLTEKSPEIVIRNYPASK